jgi:TonB family protein
VNVTDEISDEVRVRPLGRGTFVGGILVTVALHVGLASLVYFAHVRPAARPAQVHDVMLTKLVHLGKPREKFYLPRIVEPPRPKAPTPTIKVSADLAAPAAKKEPPRPRDPEPSKELKRALDRARTLARNAEEEPLEGALNGSQSGTATSASEGDAYATSVAEAIKRHWSVPTGLSVADVQNLEAEVRISISADGRMREPTMTRPSGNSLYDSSCIEAVQATRQVPPPPPGYRKGFVLVLGGKDLAR